MFGPVPANIVNMKLEYLKSDKDKYILDHIYCKDTVFLEVTQLLIINTVILSPPAS